MDLVITGVRHNEDDDQQPDDASDRVDPAKDLSEGGRVVQRFRLPCIRDRQGTKDDTKNEKPDHTEDGRFFFELRALKMFQGVVLLHVRVIRILEGLLLAGALRVGYNGPF